jgi:hypothetical protein
VVESGLSAMPIVLSSGAGKVELAQCVRVYSACS